MPVALSTRRSRGRKPLAGPLDEVDLVGRPADDLRPASGELRPGDRHREAVDRRQVPETGVPRHQRA